MTGIGSGTLRRLVYGDSRTGAPVERIRTMTAQKLLTLKADTPATAPGQLHDAVLTRRQLTPSIATEWTVRRLAEEPRLDAASHQATTRRETLRAFTAFEVGDLHQGSEKADQSEDPLPEIDGDDAFGDLGVRGDDDPMCSPPGRGLEDAGMDVDLVAVERAMRGEVVFLTPGERLEAVDRLTARGRSLREIAVLLRTSPRTIARRRRRTD